MTGSSKKIMLMRNLSSDEMITVIEDCQLAIAPASSMLFELCCVKIPIISGYYIENQIDMHNGFLERNCMDTVFDFRELKEGVLEQKINAFKNADAESINKILQNQHNTISGKSKKRLTSIFVNINPDAFAARRAGREDVGLYFNWVNDPEVRKASIKTEKIEFKNHEAWFYGKLKSQDAYLYLVSFNDAAIGQVRFDIEGDKAVIDYSIDAQYRGLGMGVMMLQKAMESFRSEPSSVSKVAGFVRTDNFASNSTFEKLDFSELAPTNLQGNSYRVFEKRYE